MRNTTLRSAMMALLAAAMILGITPLTFAQSKTASQETGMRASDKKGASLYGTYCSFCHGKHGQGYLADKAPALGNQNFLKSADNAYITQAIIHGRPGTTMSAWGKAYGGALTNEDVQAIVSYLRRWQRGKPVDLSSITISGNAGNGAEIYRKHCAVCHGKKGSKGKFIELDNPVFQQTASDGFIQYAVLHGRPGTPMPSFKTRLTGKEVNDVIAYIRTLKGESAPKTAMGGAENVPVSKATVGVLNPGKELAVFSLSNKQFVSVDEVHKAYAAGKSFILLDARPHSDYLKDHIMGAVSIPFYDVKKELSKLPKNIWIIAYCACPHAMSAQAAAVLKAAGYHKVGILNEGFFNWKGKGYPTQSGDGS